MSNLTMKCILAAGTAVMFVAGASAQAQLPSLVPGLIGNVVQVGVGTARVGSTTGLIGPKGTPTTVVGAAVLTPSSPPQGSVASVGVANAGQPLSIRVNGH